jgi:hypothetical protein
VSLRMRREFSGDTGSARRSHCEQGARALADKADGVVF